MVENNVNYFEENDVSKKRSQTVAHYITEKPAGIGRPMTYEHP